VTWCEVLGVMSSLTWNRQTAGAFGILADAGSWVIRRPREAADVASASLYQVPEWPSSNVLRQQILEPFRVLLEAQW
jgi:hypothetical protein